MKRVDVVCVGAVLLMALSLVGTVQAIDFLEGGDGLWNNPANWDTGLVPVITDDTKISNLGTVTRPWRSAPESTQCLTGCALDMLVAERLI